MHITGYIAVICFLFWLAAGATQAKIKKQTLHIAVRYLQSKIKKLEIII